jgi:hypothetical protein
MNPRKEAPSRAWMFAMMGAPGLMKAQPVKEARNRRAGIQAGMSVAM